MNKREQFLRVLLASARQLGWRDARGLTPKDATDMDLNHVGMELQMIEANMWIRGQLSEDVHWFARDIEAWLCIFDTMRSTTQEGSL